MLVVAGTKRSGTSLWMRILSEAGYRYIGDRFPRNWEQKLKEANPGGFYESQLRNGIYWETNPNPGTGRFLHPTPTRELLVKVFLPGLVRSDMAYLHRVVASIRPWRQVVRSLRRLRQVEAEVFGWAEKDKQPGYLPPDAEWLHENFLLARDLRKRQYPHCVVAHARLMRDPAAEIARVLSFIDGPVEKTDELAALIDTDLFRHRERPEVATMFSADVVDLIDTWQGHVDEGRWDDLEGLKALNEAWKKARAEGWLATKYRWDDPRVAGE